MKPAYNPTGEAKAALAQAFLDIARRRHPGAQVTLVQSPTASQSGAKA